jgi:hypothetical protein
MSRSLLTPLPVAILTLFLLGFPCRAMMLYMGAPEAPAQHCCEDCDESPQAPSQGCQTLCVASGTRIVLHSADDSTTGIPVDSGLVEWIAPDPLILPTASSEPTVSVALESPPLYLQNSSFLI